MNPFLLLFLAGTLGGGPVNGDSSHGSILNRRGSLDGLWGLWGTWSDCSVTCGSGAWRRNRKCETPALACIGSTKQTHFCELPPCPPDSHDDYDFNIDDFTHRDGHDDTDNDDSDSEDTWTTAPPSSTWATWERWGDCSTSCGEGLKRRKRVCHRTAHVRCNGSSSQIDNCIIVECPEPGTWEIWGPWTRCSVSCGSGFVKRLRKCGTPRIECEGQLVEKDRCERISCPDDYEVDEEEDDNKREETATPQTNGTASTQFPVDTTFPYQKYHAHRHKPKYRKKKLHRPIPVYRHIGVHRPQRTPDDKVYSGPFEFAHRYIRGLVGFGIGVVFTGSLFLIIVASCRLSKSRKRADAERGESDMSSSDSSGESETSIRARRKEKGDKCLSASVRDSLESDNCSLQTGDTYTKSEATESSSTLCTEYTSAESYLNYENAGLTSESDGNRRIDEKRETNKVNTKSKSAVYAKPKSDEYLLFYCSARQCKTLPSPLPSRHHARQSPPPSRHHARQVTTWSPSQKRHKRTS